MIELLIIADDLTGALDTGVQFANKGICTKVLVNTAENFTSVDFASVGDEFQILVLNTETRHLSPQKAYGKIFDITQKAVKAGIPYIYKKTDSALRGNIGSELTAALQASGEKRLDFLPAFPEMGRITVSGIHYLDGIPIHESAFGKDLFDPVKCSYIPDIIHAESAIDVQVISEGQQIRESGKNTIYLYDAQTSDTISDRAETLYKQGKLKIMAGCAGFAAELPRILNMQGKTNEIPEFNNCLLIVCGSVNPITGRQLDYAGAWGFKRITLTPEQTLDPDYFSNEKGQRFLLDLERICREEKYCSIDTNNPMYSDDTAIDRAKTESYIEYAEGKGISVSEMRIQISSNLGFIAKSLIEKGINSTLFIIGGDMLLGFMNQIGCREVIPICEIVPGTVLSWFKYKKGKVLIISKSGGFGNPEFIVELAESIACSE